MHFGDPRFLVGLWIGPVIVLVALIAWRRRRAMLGRLAPAALLAVIVPRRSVSKSMLKLLLSAGALCLIAFALARPQWGWKKEEVHQAGRDVCFVLDVSRSMLAEDLAPNRLERAKMWIRDALDKARGDRVGLIAFAGSSVVRCPLTYDYGFMRFTLDDVTTGDVARGGTFIGDAIRLATREVFDTKEASYKDIILITDGDDMDSFPVEAAKAASEEGVRIIVIGIGSEEVGATIPIIDDRGRRRNLTYNGEVVRTKLNGDMLREVALATPGGRYFNVQTGDVALDDVYERVIRGADQRMSEGVDAMRRHERFQVFLALALGLLVVEGLISEYKRN